MHPCSNIHATPNPTMHGPNSPSHLRQILASPDAWNLNYHTSCWMPTVFVKHYNWWIEFTRKIITKKVIQNSKLTVCNTTTQRWESGQIWERRYQLEPHKTLESGLTETWWPCLGSHLSSTAPVNNRGQIQPEKDKSKNRHVRNSTSELFCKKATFKHGWQMFK